MLISDKMLLWRRNLKYYNYSQHTTPVDIGIIWRIIGTILTIFIPYFIAFAMGRFWAEYDIQSIATTAKFNEAILILHLNSDPDFKVLYKHVQRQLM
jgi:hypothetical protein